MQIVVDTYERARAWIVANPDEAETILAEAAKIPKDVAARQLAERTHLDISPIPGPEQRAVLTNIAPLLVSENLVKSRADVDTALDTLFEPRFARDAAG